MTAIQIAFVKALLPFSIEAGAAFNMNPSILLAQAALESGWGESHLAREANNFFGLTGYGCSNAYWHGGKITVKAAHYEQEFRRYASRRDSFHDFARLIRGNYRRAWSVSSDPVAYATEIAYSLYISELNGDDRETYRRSMILIEREVRAIIELLNPFEQLTINIPIN